MICDDSFGQVGAATELLKRSTSDALPFGRLWYAGPNAVSNAIDYANHRSRSHDAVIRVYDDAGNAIETHEHKGARTRVIPPKRRRPHSFGCEVVCKSHLSILKSGRVIAVDILIETTRVRTGVTAPCTCRSIEGATLLHI